MLFLVCMCVCVCVVCSIDIFENGIFEYFIFVVLDNFEIRFDVVFLCVCFDLIFCVRFKKNFYGLL